MQTSSNYGLKLMEGTDNVKRQDFVDNFTKIDTEMRAIENGGYPIVEATGTNAYVGANVRIKSLGKGTKLTLFVSANANGNCSLNLNSYGTKNIKDSNGNIVTNMKANIPYNLCYNGTDFILQGKGGGGNLIPKYLLAGYYGEGDNGRVDGAMVNRGAVTQTLSPDGMITLPEGYYNSVKITQSLPVLTGVRMATGVAKWEDGGLAVYPEKGYQKGGSGDGEIKVSVAQIQSVNGWLKPQNILAGCEICGINGTATIESMGGSTFVSGTGSVTLTEKQSRILVDFSAKVPSTVRVIWGKFTSGSSFYFVNFRSETSGTFKPIVWDKYYSKYADENPVAITGINLGDGDSSHTWSAGTYTYTWYAI
ncbi:hypothetical protein [Clostridium butyricum]|uniref:hypothetical protein n=1 Tax=Clostridium butyricum TaxID=1492 RepID=UPI001FAA983F|nr:hypothetical protein [Clostridium butyricum]